MVYLTQVLAMLAGIALVLWGRAFLASGSKNFDWRFFLADNSIRVMLCVIGAGVLTICGYFDAAGLQTAIEKLGLEIQIGTGFMTGFGLGLAGIVILPTLGARNDNS